MKRSILGLLLIGALAASSHALTPAVNIQSVQIGSDGIVYFQTDGGFPSTRWWVISPTKNNNADATKSMITTLLTAKSCGIRIQMEDWGPVDAYNNYVKIIRMQ